MRCCKVAIEANACFIWALLLLVLPIRWILGFLVASAVHELCHVFALRMFHKPVLQLRIGHGGVKMDVPELSPIQECFCALAGPVGGFLLWPLGRWYPELALCAGIQSCYNLLPVYPFDGGRVLRGLTQILVPQYSDMLCAAAEILVYISLLAAGIWLKWSFLAVCMVVFLALKVRSGKIPCKHTVLGVQ